MSGAVGLVLTILGAVVVVAGLLGFGKIAFRRGEGDAFEKAAEAWESRSRAQAKEIEELRADLSRTQGKVDQLEKVRGELSLKVEELSRRPDYSELIGAHQTLVNLVRESVENENRLREHFHNTTNPQLSAINLKLDELLQRKEAA